MAVQHSDAFCGTSEMDVASVSSVNPSHLLDFTPPNHAQINSYLMPVPLVPGFGGPMFPQTVAMQRNDLAHLQNQQESYDLVESQDVQPFAPNSRATLEYNRGALVGASSKTACLGWEAHDNALNSTVSEFSDFERLQLRSSNSASLSPRISNPQIDAVYLDQRAEDTQNQPIGAGVNNHSVPNPTEAVESWVFQEHPQSEQVHQGTAFVVETGMNVQEPATGDHANGPASAWEKRQAKRSKIRWQLWSTNSQSVAAFQNCHSEEIPPVLTQTCPEEERYIFESRWRHRKSANIWVNVEDDYFTRFKKRVRHSSLQMKYRRTRSKYMKWLREDESILCDAWALLEENRYRFLLDIYHHMGGSRNLELNASDIEAKVVEEMKLDQYMLMSDGEDGRMVYLTSGERLQNKRKRRQM